MPKHIAVIDGHPDPDPKHYGHALAEAYRRGAEAAGREVRLIEIGKLDFPVLRDPASWEAGPLPPGLEQAQQTIGWADHLVIIYPLWLGTMPALLKAFLEQISRPGFAFAGDTSKGTWKKLLKGKSARIVITMGMPAFVYRWYFGGHSLKSLKRNILGFVGIGPIRATLIGMVEGAAKKREKWLGRIEQMGRDGA